MTEVSSRYFWPAAPAELHLVDCDGCPECEAWAPSEDPSIAAEAQAIAGWSAAGVTAGLALTWVLDRVAGGPGLGVMLGS